jgi:hypothetical protein
MKMTSIIMMTQLALVACLVLGANAKHSSQDSKAFLNVNAKASAHELYSEESSADDFPDFDLEHMEMPGGGSMPLTQHSVEWKAESELPPVLQYTFAGLWITMLCSLPFILPMVDRRPVTKTQMIVGGLMLVVLLGGFWLFTNIILFQSVHFKKIRPLTVVECIYFMSQVITTVGYGDVTPAKIRGQVFVGLYVIGAMFIIAMVISDLTNHLVSMAKEYKHKLASEKADQAAAAGGAAELTLQRSKTVKNLVAVEKPSPQPLLTALAVFAVIDLCWVAFFALNEKEGKTVFQAVYMSVITLSTVGFGYFTPVTEPGMVFGAFFMLIGSAALVNVITNFTELMVKMNEWERFNDSSSAAAVKSLSTLTGGSREVTEAQFLEFTLLQMQCVNEDQLHDIREAFNNLKPQKGLVSLKAIEDSLIGPTPR